MFIVLLNKHYDHLGAYSHSAAAAICDPRFNVGIHFKDVFYQYQERDVNIRQDKFKQTQNQSENDVDINNQSNDDENSDAELYSQGPRPFDSEPERRKWLKHSIVDRNVDILQFWKAK